MLRGHRTQGAYTDLTDDTNQPEPQTEDPIPAVAEAPHAADEPAELTAEMPSDVPEEAVVVEPEPEPEPPAIRGGGRTGGSSRA